MNPADSTDHGAEPNPPADTGRGSERGARTSDLVIQLNGEPWRVPNECTVAQLLEEQQVGKGPLAVELNRAVLPRARWDTRISAGDQIEIVSFVGGG